MFTLDKALRRLAAGRKPEQPRETIVDIAQIYDAESFVAQGLGSFEERINFQPVIAETGFTDLQSGEFYRLKPYTPAARSLLRIAKADIYFPNVIRHGLVREHQEGAGGLVPSPAEGRRAAYRRLRRLVRSAQSG